MGRPRKEEKTAELMISVEDFARTRDSVVTGLTTLQTAVSDLLRSYIKHTNSVLGSTPHSLDTIGISNPLGGDILAGALRNASPAIAAAAAAAASTADPATATAVADPAEESKKGKRVKKEKKWKDPNEPKRPLTIYFLYAASARPIVKQDLGGDAQPGQIEQEIHRRWQALSEQDKAGWKEVYSRNRDQYLKDMEKFKADKAAAGVETAVESPAATEEDIEMVDDANAGAAAEEGSGSASSSTESSSEEEEESEKEPTPPPKISTPPADTKTPAKGSKRRKTTRENGTAATTAPAQVGTPIPLPSAGTTSTPVIRTKADRKVKKEEHKAAAKDEQPKADEAKAEEAEPKKKRVRKPKGAAAEETAAAAAPEPATAPATPAVEKKNKRKRKSEGATA